MGGTLGINYLFAKIYNYFSFFASVQNVKFQNVGSFTVAEIFPNIKTKTLYFIFP